ncbi:MAG TPA: cytochrome c [Candidatus Acidoferrales bacterium]|nr:cytochrome c [Candidatus Acidoferrales bacterium]
MDKLMRVSVRILLFAGVLALFSGSAIHADDSASVYKTKCAVCHAPDGSGNSVMGKKLGAKDLRSDEVQKKSDAELNGFITNGMGKTMPAYKDKLTADQIKGLVAYIRELGKNK